MFFVMVKMVHPDTRAGWSDIKTKLETTKMSQFKHGISKENLHIEEWINEISIAVEYYSENFSWQFNLYYTSSRLLFK